MAKKVKKISKSDTRREDGIEDLPSSTVCPILAAYGRRLNDILPDDFRQKLKPMIDSLHSRDAKKEDARLRLLVLASARVFAAKAMDYAQLHEQAKALRAIRNNATFTEVNEIVAKAAMVAGVAWTISVTGTDRAAKRIALVASATSADSAAKAAKADRATSAARAADAAWEAAAKADSEDIYQSAIDVFKEALAV